MGAKVRPALADHDLLYCRSAHRAGLAGSAVGIEIVLEFTPAVDPIQAGTEAADTLAQYLLDGLMQALSLGEGQGIGFTQGVDPSSEQALICIDIAQAGNERLVQQQGFDGTGVRLQHFV